jgi:hypothetical protein
MVNQTPKPVTLAIDDWFYLISVLFNHAMATLTNIPLKADDPRQTNLRLLRLADNIMRQMLEEGEIE